jgi:hypothetical protein
VKTIFSEEEFLSLAAALPESDQSLFAWLLREHAAKIQNGGDPTVALHWYNEVVFRSQFVGQIIDFTLIDLGMQHALEVAPIGLCPLCGRKGVVSRIDPYPYFTEHVIFVMGAMVTKPLDTCKWGEHWPDRDEDYRPDGVRVVQSPALLGTHTVYTRSDNFGLGISTGATRPEA